MMTKRKHLGILILLIIIVTSGCKVTFGPIDFNKNNNEEYKKTDDANKTQDDIESGIGDELQTPHPKDNMLSLDSINSQDIKKIKIDFTVKDSAKSKSSNIKTITIEPNDNNYKCSYSSPFLDKAIECELSKENFESIYNSTKNNKNVDEKYKNGVYYLNDIGTCLLQINATNGDADNSSIDENLRKAFLCNICHDIFPLNWKSDIKDISGNYYRIRFALYDYIKDNKFTCVNSASYIENVDYFVKGKDFYELYFKLTPEESSKIFSERYTYEYDSTLSVALSRLSEQIPLKLEYYNLFSKINIDKILSCDETNNIALDGKKPKEPAYIIDIVDNKGNEKKAYIKKNNISKTGQKEQIHNILQWNKDHL